MITQREVLALVTALLGGLTVMLVLARLSITIAGSHTRALADYLKKDEGSREEDRPVSKEAMIMTSLGLPFKANLLAYVPLIPAVGLGLVGLAMGFPLLMALGIGILAYIILASWLEDRWRGFKLEVERELPTFVSRMAATLLVTPSPVKSLEEVIDTFDEASTLRAWLAGLLAGLRAQGRHYLSRVRDEAGVISPALALVVFQLDRVFETGGTGFAKAFAKTAEELSAILEARAVAGAKAEGARGAVRLMLMILSAIVLIMLSSEQMREGFRDPTVQVIALIALGVMAFGYTFLNGMIDQALEG